MRRCVTWGWVVVAAVNGCTGHNSDAAQPSLGGAGGRSAAEDAGGGGPATDEDGASAAVAATELRVAGSPATDGVFDPAPMSDETGNLWMSHSSVGTSPHDASLTHVRTRIASSSDEGLSWIDVGVDPNNIADPDLQVPDGSGGTRWASWHFEVSSLLYDPYDSDPSRRWKLLWHRLLAVEIGGMSVSAVRDGWIGLSTAPLPNGPWSAERKLFTGSAYDGTAVDSFLGAPEFPLDRLYPAATQLGGCAAFTEPGMLAKADGIYVSLQCAGSPEKIVGLRCDRAFASCAYVGDFLAGSEAEQFSLDGEALNGFAATEMVSVSGTDYLVVSPYEQQPAPDTYRGCLAFLVSDLTTATLLRGAGAPTLVKRISGTKGSFNGACGYDPHATGSGILYSEWSPTAPHFRVFGSHVGLP